MSSISEKTDRSQPPGTRTVELTERDVRIEVRRGTENHTPLLICNGIGASLETLDPLVDEIEETRTVIRFDVPGVGESPTPRLPYRLTQLAWLMDHLLNRFGIPEVDVMGYSWGGALAQQFAFQHRRRCRRLVLVATSTGLLSVPGDPRALSRMLTPRRHYDTEWATEVAPILYGGAIRQRPWLAGELLGAGPSGGLRGYLFQLSAIAGWSSLPWLPFIRQKTLLIFGNDDPIIPVANGRLLHTFLPHSELFIFPGGHLDVLTDAHDIAPVIDRFLDRD